MRTILRFFLLFSLLALLAVQLRAEEAPTGPAVVIDRRVPLYAGPSPDQPVIARLHKHEKVNIVGRAYGWYKVEVSATGWVAEDHLRLSLDGQVRLLSRARRVISTAQSLLGYDYVYGRAGPRSFDCSGLIQYVYGRVRVDLPRETGSQMRAGKKVNRNELAPGDLVFFATDGGGHVSHVGLYLFAGEFIHASSGRRRVTTSTMSRGFYERAFVGACRVL